MNRFETVIRLADDRPDLEGVAERLLNAVRETKAAGEDPQTDPAVLLMGAHIAFVVHADVSTDVMYRKLIDQCSMRAHAARGEARSLN